MKNTQFTYEDSVKRIESIGGKPIAVEAQWDGDTNGWFLMMFVIVKKGFLWKKIETHHLGNIALGGDIRVFEGKVPPYPEARLAQEIGKKLKGKYNLEFFFPSPINPDDDCPRWTEKDKAINCEDCNKLIIPTDSPYLPKEICYNCHLNRESNEKIKNQEPYDKGGSVSLFKDGEYREVWSSTDFDMIPISKFLTRQIEKVKLENIPSITIEENGIKSLIQNLEKEINKELENYEKPIVDSQMAKFVTIKKENFKGREIELMDRFNSNHEKISKLIYTLKIVNQAKEDNYQIKIQLMNGVTYRDDSFLRFVNYVNEGSARIEDVIKKYNGVLSKQEINSTIKKLKDFGCLTSNNGKLEITESGINIL